MKAVVASLAGLLGFVVGVAGVAAAAAVVFAFSSETASDWRCDGVCTENVFPVVILALWVGVVIGVITAAKVTKRLVNRGG